MKLTKKQIRKIKRKDRAEQQALYKHLYVRFFSIARRYAGDKDDANRIFNDAMMKVFQTIEAKKEIGNVEVFASVVLRNTGIDHIRKVTNYKKHVLQIEESSQHSDYTDVNEALNTFEAEALLEIINRLSKKEKTVFYMKEVDGYSHKEIAERLEIKIGHSKWLLSESKKNLRKIIVQYFPQYKIRS